MIFICYSSKDRESIAEQIYHRLSDYGLPVWFDRREMFMGDERNYKNFDQGIEKSTYAIVIVSPASIHSACVQEEVDRIKSKYMAKEIELFPILYNVTARNLPEKYVWIRDLVYKELESDHSVDPTCNHIMCKVLANELQQYKMRDINSALSHFSPSLSSYLRKMLSLYSEISGRNKNARMALLYAIIVYLQERFSISDKQLPYHGALTFLMNKRKLDLAHENRECLIIERLCALYMNIALA